MNITEITSQTNFYYIYDFDLPSYKDFNDIISKCRKIGACGVSGASWGNKSYFVELDPAFAYDQNTLNPVLVKVSQNAVAKDDKIFFADSTFPSLLLGRLNVGVKRTTKANTADKIIMDNGLYAHEIFHRLQLIDFDKAVVIECTPSYRESQQQYISKVNKLINLGQSKFGVNFKLYASVILSTYEIYDTCSKYPSKVTSTKELTKYVISNLPKIKEEECENICYMLKSQDEATVKLGLGTLQYYNFIDYGLEVINSLANTKSYQLPDNRDAEYIYSVLGVSKNQLYALRHYSTTRKINFLMDCFNHFVISPSMTVKEKAYTTLRAALFNDIVEHYKNDLDRLKITLSFTPNDQNGETNASPEAVEGA